MTQLQSPCVPYAACLGSYSPSGMSSVICLGQSPSNTACHNGECLCSPGAGPAAGQLQRRAGAAARPAHVLRCVHVLQRRPGPHDTGRSMGLHHPRTAPAPESAALYSLHSLGCLIDSKAELNSVAAADGAWREFRIAFNREMQDVNAFVGMLHAMRQEAESILINLDT